MELIEIYSIEFHRAVYMLVPAFIVLQTLPYIHI